MNGVLFFGGIHDVVTTSPSGGYRDSIKGVTFDDAVVGGISIPAYAPASSMCCVPRTVGRNSVRAYAVSDLSKGSMRAGHAPDRPSGGTSIILEIDADMPVTTMVRAAITSMEAVTCVMQDLDIRDADGNVCSGCSRLSVAVVRNRGSDLYIRGTGKHSKMGQIIGEAVYEAVKRSALINGLPEPYGSDALSRLARAGAGNPPSRDIVTDPRVDAMVSAVISVMDGVRWGLIPSDVGTSTARSMIESFYGEPLPEGDDVLALLADRVASDIP